MRPAESIWPTFERKSQNLDEKRVNLIEDVRLVLQRSLPKPATEKSTASKAKAVPAGTARLLCETVLESLELEREEQST
jgi:hypothetical protein